MAAIGMFCSMRDIKATKHINARKFVLIILPLYRAVDTLHPTHFFRQKAA
jgi:hypothetical protein